MIMYNYISLITFAFPIVEMTSQSVPYSAACAVPNHITLGPHWNHTGTTLEPHWNHTGTTLEPHWNHTETTPEPHRNHTGTTPEPHWNHT